MDIIRVKVNYFIFRTLFFTNSRTSFGSAYLHCTTFIIFISFKQRLPCFKAITPKYFTLHTQSIWVCGEKKPIVKVEHVCARVCVCVANLSPTVCQKVWRWVRLSCQQPTVWTSIDRDWLCARFVFCFTVVNLCTLKAWIFLMPVQNATKKEGIHLSLTLHAFHLLLLHVWPSCKEMSVAEKDAVKLSVTSVVLIVGDEGSMCLLTSPFTTD